jgi:hypothetical protein
VWRDSEWTRSKLIADPLQTRCSSFHDTKLLCAHSSIRRIFLLALNDSFSVYFLDRTAEQATRRKDAAHGLASGRRGSCAGLELARPSSYINCIGFLEVARRTGLELGGTLERRRG